MNALAFRHVAQVGLCKNVTVFRGFFTRGAGLLAGFFIIYLFFCRKFRRIGIADQSVSKTLSQDERKAPYIAKGSTIVRLCYSSMNSGPILWSKMGTAFKLCEIIGVTVTGTMRNSYHGHR
jgi:hypothetical protein